MSADPQGAFRTQLRGCQHLASTQTVPRAFSRRSRDVKLLAWCHTGPLPGWRWWGGKGLGGGFLSLRACLPQCWGTAWHMLWGRAGQPRGWPWAHRPSGRFYRVTRAERPWFLCPLSTWEAWHFKRTRSPGQVRGPSGAAAAVSRDAPGPASGCTQC